MPKGDAWSLIQGCISNHKHVDTQKLIAQKYQAFQLSMFRDVLSDYADGTENDACWIGTLMLILDKPNLRADDAKASITIMKGGKGDHSIAGKGKPARKSKCGTSPAQADLINRLISEIGELNQQAADILLTIYTEEWHNTVAWAKISPAIDSLFAAKRSESAKVVKAESAKVEKLGLKEDDICVMGGEYYKIHRARAGHLYAIVWADECWNWDATPKGVIKRLTPEMLATAEQAATFGHTFHRCVFCTLSLTDPRSEGVGYGPTCADKRGLPWG
jgi:hypothetical protein